MLQEEFSRLIFMYNQAAEGKGTTVQEIFQKSLEFIEHLKEVLIKGDEEDKKAALRMMKELYGHMQEHTKIMSQRSGLSEEKLIADSENPANFTPEQWRNMQESRMELAKAGEDLVKLLHTQEKPSPESIKPKAEKKKGPKKSKWMRS